MDSTTCVQTVFESKTGYSHDLNYNFAMDGELTVTVTLEEYRALLKENSIHKYEIEKQKNEKWEYQRQVEVLTKKCEALQQKLSDYVCGRETEND